MSTLRIALAQVNACVGDIAGNATLIKDRCRAARDQGAEVVAFPEMVLTGYPIEDLALRESFQRATAAALQGLASDLQTEGLGDLTVVLGSLGVDPDGRPLNEAAVVRGGAVQQRYAKHHLPNYGVFDERRIFATGDEPCVVEVHGRRLGVVICEDIWVDGGPVAALAHEGIDLLVVLNGSPFEEGKGMVRTDLVRRRAAEVNAPVAYVNLWGGQDDLVFDGHSFVVGADGAWVANAPGFEDALLVWDLADAGSPAVPGPVVDFASDTEQVYRACVTGLRDYVVKNGFSSVILGMSGGIDSALTAAIAADALGGDKVVGVSMPSEFSSEHSKDDAADLAKRLGADYRVEPIAPMVEAFQRQLALTGVAEENLQARVRGVILMGLSNREGHLVIAPGNKSELATGYATIYDAGSIGGFAPLKDVDKTRVWDLARWRNAHAEATGAVPPIPENSITKPPSAELRPGQTDQDSLPEYDLLDEVLDAYVEHAEGREELLARGFDEAVVDKVLSLVDRAEWKRRQYPPGPKVTALAFGRDRRLPITSRWRELS
ncbi:NAD+ synthase [Demequina globuliformis]|uniref:NAD+ synthase n=1 Tax=Demequina globuliformis TaxID=676202 RepID=UPI000785DA8F|nr:NAD+ synthase [Demequina globuliformis]